MYATVFRTALYINVVHPDYSSWISVYLREKPLETSVCHSTQYLEQRCIALSSIPTQRVPRREGAVDRFNSTYDCNIIMLLFLQGQLVPMFGKCCPVCRECYFVNRCLHIYKVT